MSVAVVIPARFASSRYPGKPLVKLKGATGIGRSLLERTWRVAEEVEGIDKVVVATDDPRIADHAAEIGAECLITSADCRNGTERCAEAAGLLDEEFDTIVNLQGDAPLTPPWFISDLLSGLASDPSVGMATPVLQCSGKMMDDLKRDRSEGRVGGTTAVFDRGNHALYFSKEVVPFSSRSFSDDEPTPVFHHVGVYAYRRDALMRYGSWDIGPYETEEGLEQLRFLENGASILCVEMDARGREFWELNNPEDVAKIGDVLKENGFV